MKKLTVFCGIWIVAFAVWACTNEQTGEVKKGGKCEADYNCVGGQICKGGVCSDKTTTPEDEKTPTDDKKNEPDGGAKEEPPTKDEAGQQRSYPKGPYGVDVGNVFPPDITVSDCTGKKYTSRDIVNLKGVKVLYLSLHAGWCGPCKKQSAQMRGQKDKYGDALLVWNILLEDTTPGSKKVPKAFCEKHKKDFNFNFPQMVDEGGKETDKLFDRKAYPFALIVSVPDMKIQYKKSGALDLAGMNNMFDILTSD